MSNEVIVCRDCQTEFEFSASEADFFASRGLTKPKRCKACRQQRRAQAAPENGEASVPATRPVRQTQWTNGGDDASSSRRRSKGSRPRGEY